VAACTVIAMQDRGAGAGARHGGAAARPTSFLSCHRTSMGPPGRGDQILPKTPAKRRLAAAAYQGKRRAAEKAAKQTERRNQKQRHHRRRRPPSYPLGGERLQRNGTRRGWATFRRNYRDQKGEYRG
jgi:hypothetical protein